jgi:CHAT domain-containing protein
LPPAEELVASRFVRALASGEMDALASLSAREATTSPDWNVLRNLIETYDCISIPSHRVTIERASASEMTLLVEVHATAVARGATRTALRFPRRWRIEARLVAGEWRLRNIIAEERLIARCLAAEAGLTPEAILAAAGDSDLEGILMQLAEELSALGYDKAQAPLGVVRSMARSHELKLAEVVSLRWLAVAAGNKLKTRAADVAREARGVAAASGSPDARALAFLTSGTVEWQNGHHEAALEHYAAAAALMEVVDDPHPAMKALYMRGMLVEQRGAIRDALISSAALERAAERFDWTEGRCITAFQMADSFTQLQDAQAARYYAAEALRCSQRLRNQEFIVLALSNLAEAEGAVGNHIAAAGLMQKILDQTSTDDSSQTAMASTHYRLALILAEADRYREAEAEILAALARTRGVEKLFKADLLQALARIRLLDGRRDEALRTAKEADAIVRDASDTVGIYLSDPSWAVRATLGSTLRAAGKLPEATAVLHSSVELIEAVRAGLGPDEVMLSGFMRNKAQPYRDLVSLLVERGRLREAVAVTERFRARALGTSAARGHVDRLPSMSDSDRERYDALNDTISGLNRKLLASGNDSANIVLRERLAQERVEQRVFLARLYAGSAAIRARNVDDPQTIVADARRLLPRPGESVLTFSVHDDETFGFYIERSGDDLVFAVHRIAMRRGELEGRIRGFVRQIEGRNLDYRRSARSLYDLLVAPFAARIKSKRLLYVVPDGMLWELPFQALLAPNGEYLIERIAVAYAPSLALLRHQRGARPPSGTSRSLLAVADPVLPPASESAIRATTRGASLTPLPDARTEVLEIAKLYGPTSRVLVGAEATETAVKRLAAAFPVLHLATHGVIDDASPMYSAVVLGTSSADDGLLEAREMMNLELGADLAILSACESGSGDVTPGEGLIGMSWALMVAGCRNTVVSRWKVDSRSTAALMIAFHRRISRSDSTYASALRHAQLTLLRQEAFSHPYYWSPFVLISTSQ